MNVSEQMKAIFLPQVTEALTALVPVLIQVAVAIIALCCVVVATYFVVKFICPELSDFISGVAGGMWDNYIADRKERFMNSPVGRGYALYKERSGVHDSTYMPIESYSLGPREDFDSPLGDGVDYIGYGNIHLDHVDRED